MAKAKAKAKPRKKTPGVRVVPPKAASRKGWCIRWTDPDSGKEREATIPALAARTAEGRAAFAARKSQEVQRRKRELAEGAPRETGLRLADAIARYFAAHPHLSPRTVEDYRRATSKLEAWAGAEGVRSADELTRARLLSFRETVIAAPREAVAARGKRGERRPVAERRAPETINGVLRKVRTVLGYLADADLLPRSTHDDLRRALKRLPAPKERIEFLSGSDLAALLRAALAHDAQNFAETRAEHAGAGPKGATSRYEPIAPFVAFVLLTGARLGEALSAEWRDVALSAGPVGPDGKPVGEIHLRASAVKTRTARTVDLAVSPALRELLAALGEAAGEAREGKVFPFGRGVADAAAKRLRGEHRAPGGFAWQALRRTCGTFLTNAPGIFGAASAYRSAKQLGHSVVVAEQHYLGLARGISADARTLEAAMGVETEAAAIVEATQASAATRRPDAQAPREE